MMAKCLAGLITRLLSAIYCRKQRNEKESAKRARELRIKIENEAHIASYGKAESVIEHYEIQTVMQVPDRDLWITYMKRICQPSFGFAGYSI